jgi:cytochrome c-type biogenesis protein CcmH/NrfG
MPILETIAAANAAYSVIRKCLENGREVKDMVGQVGKFLTAEEELQEAVKKKKNSPITAITGGQEGDWEEFQALERIREQRRELESWCRLYAPAGTWARWQSYQVEARKRRQEAKKAAQKAYEKRMEQIQITSGILLAVTVCVLGIYYLGVYLERW